MKIGFIRSNLRSGEESQQVINLANALVYLGHDVTIYHSNGGLCTWMECKTKIESANAILNQTHDVLVISQASYKERQLIKKADSKLRVFYLSQLSSHELLMQHSLKWNTLWKGAHREIWLLRKYLYEVNLIITNNTSVSVWLANNLGLPSNLFAFESVTDLSTMSVPDLHAAITIEQLTFLLNDRLKDFSFNRSYVGFRNDVAALVPNNSKRILDVGCSAGTLGESLYLRNKASVVGVELDPEMAKRASEKLERVIVGNVEELNWEQEFDSEEFDCIVFADILEHLRDPWKTLRFARTCLKKSGTVIISIPNIGHITVINNLLFKRHWPYRDRGIHDKTHLRFFTLKNLYELLEETGYGIEQVERRYRITDSHTRINQFASWVALPVLKELVTYQYLIVARKIIP